MKICNLILYTRGLKGLQPLSSTSSRWVLEALWACNCGLWPPHTRDMCNNKFQNKYKLNTNDDQEVWSNLLCLNDFLMS